MKKILAYTLLFLGTAGYAAAQQVNFQRTPSGILYHIFPAAGAAGPKIKMGDVITMHITEKTGKDSVLFSSYAIGHPVQAQVQPTQNILDLMDVFPLLSVKDSALVRIPADSAVKGHEAERPPFLPKGSYITATVKILKIQTQEEFMGERNAELEKRKQAEAAEVNKYITDHKLVARTTPSGLKYVITRGSMNRKPVVGDTLLVNYTGRLLNGKVFDSSIQADAVAGGLQQPGRTYEPIQVIVGKGQVIPGWDEGLLLLNENAKATFVIPSNLAYGAQGAGDIPPYSTLVFDIELAKIKPARHVITPKPAVKKTTTHTTAKKTVRKS